MTPQAAARIQKHGRRLLTNRIITPAEFTVLDCCLWRCRAPGRADLAVTYAAIGRLCGIATSTAVLAIAKLVQLGIIAKTKRRARFLWGRGQLASRQIANAYRFLTSCTGSDDRPTDKGIERFLPSINSKTAPKIALEAVLASFAATAGFAMVE